MSTSAAKEQEVVLIQLGTTVAQANAAAVASTMQAVVAIVEQTAEQLKLNEKLLLKARPFSEGSFEIPLELVIVGGAWMFGNQSLIDEILRMLKQFIEAKKLLRGKPPPAAKNDGGSIVINGDLVVSNSVVNILVNSKVNSAVDKAAVDVAGDETIKHVKVFTGEERTLLASIEREELEYFRTSRDPGSALPTRDRHERATVVVRTLVFEGNAKWSFLWEGRAIRADIQDPTFMKDVLEGNEEFARGDRLDVDLIIHQDYDESLAEYTATGYTIMKIYKHSKRPKAGERTLFDEPSNETQ